MPINSLDFTFLRGPKEEPLKVVSGDKVIFREPTGYVNPEHKEILENQIRITLEKLGQPPYKIDKITEDTYSGQTFLNLVGENKKMKEVPEKYLTRY